MPVQETPKFRAVPARMLDIPQPAIGGLNLKDLEFEQSINQSPNMLNVMYRNGGFSKRYGQEIFADYPSVLYSMVYYDETIFVHAGTKIYRSYGLTRQEVGSGLPQKQGLFIVFAQKLYYLITSGFYEYDGTRFNPINAYVPDFIINAKPDGSTGGDVIDDLNLIGNKFKIIYNGEEGVTEYNVGPYDGAGSTKIIDWSVTPTILVDEIETTDFTVDSVNEKIIFSQAPGEGSMNVSMEFTMKNSVFANEREQILKCRFYDTFGGANNSRLFIAGCGSSKYYYTQAYDISYFPENNYATLGNTEEDITGFGRQYNVLVVFKPREIYSVYSYTETSSTTVIEENIGLESFRSQLVNARVGCDAPHSIQLINNLLTWYNSSYGICTLVSTNIQDERNVRTISRNIDHTNRFSVRGILDYSEDLNSIQSADFDGKYFIVFPQSGSCFVWDYEISPYRYSTSGGETDPRNLDWFRFDNIYAKQFLKFGNTLLFSNLYSKTVIKTFTNVLRNSHFNGQAQWIVDTGNPTFNSTLRQEMPSDDYNWQTRLMVVSEYFVEEGEYYFSGLVKNNTSSTLTIGGMYDATVTVGPMEQYYSFFEKVTFRTSQRIQIVLEGPANANGYLEIENISLTPSSEVGNSKELSALRQLGWFEPSRNVDIGVNYTRHLIEFNDTFADLDFDADSVNDPINSYYMTPFFQFDAVEYLKNVDNLYVQCRGDSNTSIKISYYTNDSPNPESEPEDIETGGGTELWSSFAWNEFEWFKNAWGNTFRRKCNLKKVQMASFFFENNQLDKDMSITHIGVQYKIVKNVR